ncbi:MAG: 23S rRNA (pseudouridine(1915)-N(3))-methyltransferase RlmH [Pseudomonadota bacterium]|nr:23S rRNA (pseudouridine(1915)-N(3))-methyltransferase RlmH [Pseudomonadota bacterium]MDE3038029.1 23S rRNA (pseudouridine(1915)-N(3))-methyltransferase RlmH [Pseudomonadota bacterium]
MKIFIAAIGKAKPSPERQLYDDYIRRLPWKAVCREFDAKLQDPLKRKSKEGGLLLGACQGYDKIIALDEGGKTFSSREFSETLGHWQRQGNSSFAFIIGGADGLSPEALRKAHLVWSFGRVTWPHMLVRALLAEQLYRAHSVLSGHPYHRD